MKLFLFTVSMIVAVTVNCHGLPEPPDPKPPAPQPEHQPQATNSLLESKYLNATTLVITGTSAKGVPIATKLSSKRQNDPCSSFGGQCINFNEDLKSWEQADTSCKAKGQRLAVIQDPVAFHAYMRSNHGGERFWLGGSDQKQEGTWTWINGQSLVGFPWGPGQPDDYRGNEDCLEWGWQSNYNDELCTNAQRYICEPELSECTPACQNGGICNAASECVCPDGWSGDICDKKDPCSSFGGQCINFYEDLSSWEQADTSCKAKGQRLAVIQDPVAFNAYMRSNRVGERYWLGGSDMDHEGTWTWINGQSLAGFPWPTPEPNDYRGNEDCLEWGHGSNYNDELCTRAQRYVCEPGKCTASQFECRNQKCVSSSSKCNGGNDCGDNSDEENCSLPCQCGVHNTQRIIGGTEVNPMRKYPWQIRLAVPGNTFTNCGGTIVNDRWILTAAHCIKDSNNALGTCKLKYNSASSVRIIVGEHDQQVTSDDDSNTKEYSIKTFITHPEYKCDNINVLAYDFALLELTEAIPFNNVIRPICLPQDDSETYAGQNGIVTGWGLTSDSGDIPNVLQELQVPILANDNCKRWGTIASMKMCAGGELDKDTCNGDSGGPLAVVENNKYVQVGVVSYGKRRDCANTEYPKVYARVSKILSWIATRTANGKKCD